ncbi:hypothetical protein M427DRAFT_494645 [Gonapodya prolifera JEL478]|uniref:SMAD/FHA domain-containing protein n=1 Tax=Gonapodya prolifera (strain JEL478) TaxID=1344416 RepID=A0A139AJC9_GONPJ|nr:hypothetical protein M427DRAFT_494645 [Gonapodya prolifera JEL478]|eukprot:KXS16882.1 hypothetical protein M427DRAFT_494645 [Gonapodya prolifera JEL478]
MAEGQPISGSPINTSTLRDPMILDGLMSQQTADQPSPPLDQNEASEEQSPEIVPSSDRRLSRNQQHPVNESITALESSRPSTAASPKVRKEIQMDGDRPMVHIGLFPHADPTRNSRPVIFSPIEKDMPEGFSFRIGRKVEKKAADPTKPSPEPLDFLTVEEHFVAFKSKVVSRSHAELWCKEGTIYFKDIGSSSGTFLNRMRLSPSGKESRPYPLKDGDVIQLGVDYQGRQEDVYKAITIRVVVQQDNHRKKMNPVKLHAALRALISAASPLTSSNDDVTNPTSTAAPPPIDCAVCLNALAPFQALFLAPCSHCYHYKCVRPLLEHQGVMFLCPLCRQVANLEASVSSGDLEADAGGAETEGGGSATGSEDEADSVPGAGPTGAAYNATAFELVTGSAEGVARSQTSAEGASTESLPRSAPIAFPPLRVRTSSNASDRPPRIPSPLAAAANGPGFAGRTPSPLARGRSSSQPSAPSPESYSASTPATTAGDAAGFDTTSPGASGGSSQGTPASLVNGQGQARQVSANKRPGSGASARFGSAIQRLWGAAGTASTGTRSRGASQNCVEFDAPGSSEQ